MIMDHAEVRALFGAFTTGDIGPSEKTAVQEHLETCRECRKDWMVELEFAAGLRAAGELSMLPTEAPWIPIAGTEVFDYKLAAKPTGVRTIASTSTETWTREDGHVGWVASVSRRRLAIEFASNVKLDGCQVRVRTTPKDSDTPSAWSAWDQPWVQEGDEERWIAMHSCEVPEGTLEIQYRVY